MSWRTFGALVLIALGVVFLLINFNVLPGDAWNYVFPIILVLLGITLLVGWRGGGRQLESVPDSALLSGAARGAVILKHGAGRLAVTAGTDPALLFSGTFGGGVDKKLERQGDLAVLELKTPSDVWSNVGFPGTRGLDWNLSLNPSVPLSLKYEGGAADTLLDLSGLKLTALEINTGASSTDVVLPAPAGTMRVVVHSGAASVKIRLPQNVPASIHGTMGLGALEVDMSRFPKHGAGSYESDTFTSAVDRVDVTVEGGVGSVHVR
jgi:hypothetical protein